MEQLLNKKQAAKLLAVNEKLLDRERRKGNLGWVQVGSLIRFKIEHLEQFIEQNEKRTLA